VKMDVSDDGTVTIASIDEAAAQKALSMVAKIVEVPEVGKVYSGKVKKIMEFGAFVEILPNTDVFFTSPRSRSIGSRKWRMNSPSGKSCW